jgi:hypothetical protein
MRNISRELACLVALILGSVTLPVVPARAVTSEHVFLECHAHAESFGEDGLGIGDLQLQFKIEPDEGLAYLKSDGKVFPGKDVSIGDLDMRMEVDNPDTGWRTWYKVDVLSNSIRANRRSYEVILVAEKSNESSKKTSYLHGGGACHAGEPWPNPPDK